MKVLNALSDPKNAEELAESLGWDVDEVRQVLSGFVLAELVEERSQVIAGQFVVFEPNATAAQNLRATLEDSDNRFVGKVVRDKLALQLVLKRSIPHTLIFSTEDDSSCELVRQMFATENPHAAKVRRIAIQADPSQQVDWNERLGFEPDEVVSRPCTAELLFRAMDRLHGANAGDGHDSEGHGSAPVDALNDMNSLGAVAGAQA